MNFIGLSGKNQRIFWSWLVLFILLWGNSSLFNFENVDFSGFGVSQSGRNNNTVPVVEDEGFFENVDSISVDDYTADHIDSEDVTIELAIMQHDLGNYAIAGEMFDKLISSGVNVDQSLYYKGLIFKREHEFQSALECFKSVLSSQPNHNDAKKEFLEILGILQKDAEDEFNNNPSNIDNARELAYIYFELGNLTKARDVLSPVIRKFPEDPDALDTLALIEYQDKNLSKAYSLIEKAFQIDPNNDLYFQHFRMISEDFVKSDKTFFSGNGPQNSEKQLENSTQAQVKKINFNLETNENLRSQLEQIDRYIQQKKWKHARKALKSFEENNPGHPIAKSLMEKLSETLGHSDQALELLTKALGLIKEGKNIEARQYLQKIIKECVGFSRMPTVKYYLAESYISDNLIEKAFPIFEEIAETYKYNILVYQRIGEYYYQNSKYAKAGEIFQKIEKDSNVKTKDAEMREIVLSEVRWKVWMIKIMGMKKFGVWGGGILILIFLYFMLIFNSEEKKKERILNKSKKLFAIKDYSGVLDQINNLRKYECTNNEIYESSLLMTRSCFELNDYKNSQKEARKVLKIDSSNKTAQTLLGKCFLMLDSITEEAMQEYQKMLRYDFNNYNLLEKIAKYYIKKVQGGNFDLVKKDLLTQEITLCFRKLSKRFPEQFDYVDVLAKIYLKQHKIDYEAIGIYESYVRVNSEEEVYLRILLKGYKEKEIYKKAINICQKLIEIETENMENHEELRKILSAADLLDDIGILYRDLAVHYPDSALIKQLFDKYTKTPKMVLEEPEKPTEEENTAINHFKKGCKFVREKQFKPAIVEFKKAQSDRNLRKKISIYLIKCYLSEGMFMAAEEEFNRIDTGSEMMSPDMKEICYLFGTIYEDKGDFENALKMYDRICKVDISYKDSFDKFEELFRFIEN